MKLNRNILLFMCIGMFSPYLYGGSYEFTGAGGFSVGFYNPDLDLLDSKIQIVTLGFDKIEGPLLTWGGFRYGQVSDHWRIGGFGFGSDKTISSTFIDPKTPGAYLPQDVTISAGGGGFYTEYILGHIFHRVEGAISLGIGGAGVNIKIA